MCYFLYENKMFVVYSENQQEKKYLEEEFLQQSNIFAVPLNNVKPLHDLIDRTCYEFYQKKQSIFIEKLKIFISGILDLSFSFPLLRQILALIKKKDLMADLYRNQLISINEFFMENDDTQNLFQNSDIEQKNSFQQDQFQQALKSHKTFQLLDFESDQLVSLGSFGQYQRFLKQKINNKNDDDKLSMFQSARTNDETLQQLCMKSSQQHNSSNDIKQNCLPPFITPSKTLKIMWKTVATTCQKNSEQKQAKRKLDDSVQDFINSFKKHKTSAVSQMLLNDQSISKVATKQIKKYNSRKRLQEQIYQKTRTIKSNQYTRNIKNVLLNRKLKDRKKPKVVLQRQKLSQVIDAYELKRVSSEKTFFPL